MYFHIHCHIELVGSKPIFLLGVGHSIIMRGELGLDQTLVGLGQTGDMGLCLKRGQVLRANTTHLTFWISSLS